MPHMPYARRAHLVGTSLARPPTVVVRGDRRRKDMDEVSSVPYFDGLPTSGGTVIVAHTASGGGTVTASVTAADGVIAIHDAVDQLNASLAGIDVLASDVGGCISLTSYASFQNACILEVTGGTAAAALGFDLAKQPYSARSGDLASAPEGGIGNAFGATLPIRGENFTTDTMGRALAATPRGSGASGFGSGSGGGSSGGGFGGGGGGSW